MLWARGTPAPLVTLWKPLAPLRRGFSLRSSSPRHLPYPSSRSGFLLIRLTSPGLIPVPRNPLPATSATASASSPSVTGTLLRTNSMALALSGSYARKFRTIRGFPSESNVVTLIFHPAGILSTAPLLPVLRSVWPLWPQGSTGIGHPGAETGLGSLSRASAVAPVPRLRIGLRSSSEAQRRTAEPTFGRGTNRFAPASARMGLEGIVSKSARATVPGECRIG